MAGAQLILADDGESARVSRVVSIIMPTIKLVVDDDHRAIVVTQRAPTDIIDSMIPVYPGWPPSPGRDPVPTQADTPVPSAIMGNTPSPWLIRAPCPPADWIPNPSSVVIRSPRVMVDIRDPHVTIRPFIHPPAIIIQLRFILIHFDRKITCFHISAVKRIPAPVPFGESILIGSIDELGTKGE